MHTQNMLPSPLCALRPWVCVCKLTLDPALFLVLPSNSCAHTHCANETGSSVTCYMISCNAAHVAAVTLVNARKQEGMTPAEGLGAQWGATIGSFGLHPPFNVDLTAVHTW